MARDAGSWTAHPEATVPLAVLALAYVLLARRERPEPWRAACFAAGWLLLLAAAVTPLDALTYRLLSAHLLQNVVLSEWAPLLLVLSAPPAVERALARIPAWRQLTRPAVALPLWLATVFLWHLPPAYDAALRDPALLHAEHLCYLAAGTLMWWPALRGAPWRLATGARAAYVFAAFVLASPVGLLLALLPRAVYDTYERAPRTWGLSALTDQQIAGVTMASEQAVVFFAVFLVFFLRFLREEERGEHDEAAASRA